MNWTVLKALDKLYHRENVSINQTLRESGEIAYLADPLRLIQEQGKHLVAQYGFAPFYEKHYQRNFEKYQDFLNTNNLLKSQSRFEEKDIQILIKIKADKDAGNLDQLRKQLAEADESVRGLSQMFFKNDKYLDNRSSVVDALKVILEVTHFSNEKDQQYMYRLECEDPEIIVLCENLDFLTKPNKPRKHHIELWYAGGKNIAKLQYAQTRELPIYYSCDWDYDGLFIIYPLVRQKIPNIKLLMPNGAPKSIAETEHRSIWHNQAKRNELANAGVFNSRQLILIDALIAQDQWIIEESNDLVTMLDLS
ncbi:hypothetical protein PQ469_24330 [Mucilaginibacter sp. KACC 22773]|uniref:hypothetical protein n=1 Tax=Mucilaginibacter sp. KACC 22773 TaxID=3025671 RepID=UPI0023665DC8|nr:hypothetical protein [Mucilaginibacter sp. KACC 22773]WDF77015.1 hypothetical protein PQ469_24330 [Mucilaginibacter sp. KACC 22773]